MVDEVTIAANPPDEGRASANRAPGEFRYWEHIDTRRMVRLRRLCRLVLGFDPAPPDDVVQTIGSMYYDADPLAEAFVDEVCLGRGAAVGRELIDRALAGGVDSIDDAPQSLVALFEDIERDPDWVDFEQVERGARAFRRYGTSVFRFAGAITLSAYTESSVAKPLALTGAYAGAKTKHRFLETAAFWIDVSEPGGMRPGAPGREAALRVRIMHVYVRRRLMSHPEWDLDAWGVPISQADALLTLMGGSVAPGIAMKVLGYRPTRDEIEAMMHFWRYVGHVMGVRPRWHPSDIRDALRLGFVAYVKASHGAGADTAALCRSFATAFEPDPDDPLVERLAAQWEHRLHRGYTRLFLPGPIHRRLGIPGAGPWAVLPLLPFPFVFAAETVRRRVPAVDDLMDRHARRSRRRWLRRHLGSKPAKYRPVEHFTR